MHSLQDIQDSRNAARKEICYSRIRSPCRSVHTCMNFGRNKNQLNIPVLLCKSSYKDLDATFSCCFHYTFSFHRHCCTHMYTLPVYKTVSCYSPERISFIIIVKYFQKLKIQILRFKLIKLSQLKNSSLHKSEIIH